jgi:hypothetical protein
VSYELKPHDLGGGISWNDPQRKGGGFDRTAEEFLEMSYKNLLKLKWDR